ncbi:hypothetical protein KVP97_22955, partial [Escherichia coli]|nr:hypothetical protein [Escherichia coli]
PVFHTIVSIKNDGHYFCRAGGNRPDGLNEPVTGLRQGGISEETQNDSCEKILTPTEWKLLWVKLEGKPLPAQAPTDLFPENSTSLNPKTANNLGVDNA